MIKKSHFILLILLALCFSVNTFTSLASTYIADITVPDDFQSINNAVAMAPNGGTIKIKRGTYAEAVYINKSVTLLGENNPTILEPLTVAHTKSVTIKGINFIIDPLGTEPAITATNTSKLTLENLNIKATGILLINITELYVKNCSFKGNPGPSISIRGKTSKNIKIEWCNFNQTYMALSAQQATQTIFRYNTVNTTGPSIKLQSECQNATIYMNNFLKGEAEDYGQNNRWYNETSKLGNYWADLDPSKDKNGDGIMDEPKKIGGAAMSEDKYPLAKLFTEYLKSQNQPANITTYITAAIALIATLTATTILYRKRRRKIEQK